ncbi:MAG: DUF72 domain-containing protein [Burkholderiaceae bacterium]|nr:DUF72 domain-containing protein [Burkholderiaceae bacterium]
MSARRPPADSLFDDADAAATPARARRPPAEAPVAAAEPNDALRHLGRHLPAGVHLGTSSWSFPGWRGLVYSASHGEPQLARQGLVAYAAHPVLRAVGIDRSFYQPLPQSEFARYAAQVPPNFRFVVKAPALVADAVLRGEGGLPAGDNPSFLDAALATEQFVEPALRGLGERAGPLVFQLSPLPRALTQGAAALATIDRIGAFLDALPRAVAGQQTVYAVELRNAELLTPRFVRMLGAAHARLCLGIHARMPPAARQAAALHAMDDPHAAGESWKLAGPLIVRWSLHSGFKYDEAKNRYAPFDRLIDPDLATRGTLAHLIHVAIRSSQPAYVIVNNKAEGSAPLSCIELARAVVG